MFNTASTVLCLSLQNSALHGKKKKEIEKDPVVKAYISAKTKLYNATSTQERDNAMSDYAEKSYKLLLGENSSSSSKTNQKGDKKSKKQMKTDEKVHSESQEEIS